MVLGAGGRGPCSVSGKGSILSLVVKEVFMLEMIFEQRLGGGDSGRRIERLTQRHRGVKMMAWIMMSAAVPF